MTNHEEWLSLIEVSGPFLTLPVLERVFPQGLDVLDRELATRLRRAREEWAEESVQGNPEAEAIHLAWVELVLHEALGLDDELLLSGVQISDEMSTGMAEHREHLRPDYAVVNPQDSMGEIKARLLIQVWPPDQDLDVPVEGKPWSATPAERMTTLCRSTGIRLGVVTNGERWMLVDAPVGETSGYASWYASIWSQEPLTLRAFQCLLGARRFFGVAESDTLEAMLTESVAYQQEVTDQLGFQVRQAVEVLVQALDRADQDRDRKLLKTVSPDRLYDAALTIMMRLVFLFCAEERGLLLLGDPVYDAYYAVSTLRGQLREEADLIGLEVLERRQDAWARLLATFRAVYAGIVHETLRLPALGGSLFDPDRYPFLEGREENTTWRDASATPLPIDNRTVLHLLESLQLLRRQSGRGGSEARRLSFRALDIEQIGHVYEGLLDHVAVRVESPTLGLRGAQGREPEVALDELEEKQAQNEQVLLDLLLDQTKRSASALGNDLKREPDEQTRERLRIACGNNLELVDRVLPFHALLREDAWGYPVVYRAGGFMVTGGPERRETGTQYTPQSLTETIVAETLTPLVYEGPAEGKARGKWELQPPERLLDLKICDMAMGSGAFLVQVCRWLAERLVESWENEEAQGKTVLSEGEVVNSADGRDLIPKGIEERLYVARRLISERCIYGVDVNPMAVELAKLSIWLVTMAKARPFGFLDHNLRSGDSLLGVQDLDQIRYFHMDPERGRELHESLFSPTEQIDSALEQALQRRIELRSVRILDIEDIREMTRLDHEARVALEKVEIIADLLIGSAISTAGKSQTVIENQLVIQLESIRNWLLGKEEFGTRLEATAQELLNTDRPERRKPRCPFHWPVEFPEVFTRDNPGFDAIVGNPPFMGGQKITGNLGTAYRNYIVLNVANGTRGSADLCAYFFLLGSVLVRKGGIFGLLATNSIAQGDTRSVGLDQILEQDYSVIRAVRSQKWPGGSNLEVAVVWICNGLWKGINVLEDRTVTGITPLLTIRGAISGKPYRLAANAEKSFQGSIVRGLGFVLAPEEAEALIKSNPCNKDVLFPYLNGEDLNSRPDQSASRWVINFFDWPLKRGTDGSWKKADESIRKEWMKVGIVPSDYDKPVAADYPDCLAIVEERVKPERTMRDEKGDFIAPYPLYIRWWQFWRYAPKLYSTISGLKIVLLKAQVSRTWAWAFVPNGWVYDAKLNVFSISHHAEFAILQSSIHWEWSMLYGTTLRTDMSYAPTNNFETFPFPLNLDRLEKLGDDYDVKRREIMLERKKGLTAVYNLFHDPTDTSVEIQELRELHIEMDVAVADSYGWSDLKLDHSFQTPRQGVRLMISEAVRSEVLSRLLELNYERHSEEIQLGLHD